MRRRRFSAAHIAARNRFAARCGVVSSAIGRTSFPFADRGLDCWRSEGRSAGVSKSSAINSPINVTALTPLLGLPLPGPADVVLVDTPSHMDERETHEMVSDCEAAILVTRLVHCPTCPLRVAPRTSGREDGGRDAPRLRLRARGDHKGPADCALGTFGDFALGIAERGRRVLIAHIRP
jgi:hypothetical protein